MQTSTTSSPSLADYELYLLNKIADAAASYDTASTSKYCDQLKGLRDFLTSSKPLPSSPLLPSNVGVNPNEEYLTNG